MIAKQEKVSVRELESVITKVSPVQDLLVLSHENSIKSFLEKTPVYKNIINIEINASSSHVVAYIKWKCGQKYEIDKEIYSYWVTV